MNLLAGYIRSLFQDFEIYLRTEVDLIEDDVILLLIKYNSSFPTFEIQRGIYTFKDISELLFNSFQSEYPGPSNVINFEVDDLTMKTKFVVRGGILAIKFDENRFLVLS